MGRKTEMKFAIGYQMCPTTDFIERILHYKERVYEVYFSFGDMPNGRHRQTEGSDLLPHEITLRQLSDLSLLADGDIPLNLLFNAACYGKDTASRAFFVKIGNTVDYLASHLPLRSVTTTSPLIAKFIKENFPVLSVRASVNMEIGTPEGMDYLADRFDSFYVKRELNRDFAALRRLKSYADANGKELLMLANSGCLNYCSSHVFHDNMVAHESDIMTMDNAYDYRGTCWEYLKNEEKRHVLVQGTNYVRPEDIHLYEGLVVAAKLATRVNRSPIRVLEAYMTGKHLGSICDLLEPNHSGAIYPSLLDNSLFPADFALRVGNCDKRCESCGYCKEVYKNATIQLDGEPL